MKRVTIPIAAVALLSSFAMIAPRGLAQTSRQEIDAAIHDYLATHPDEFGAMVRAYLMKNPDILKEMFTELMKRRVSANAGTKPNAGAVVDRGAAVTNNAALLFFSPHQVSLGNPTGDVTLVEFFDYSCGFCKRALPDMMTLLHDDPKLKIVLKEFPILGPGSVEAARVAIAVRMQDPGKYLAFHQRLLGAPGPASKDKALAAAKDVGLDVSRLEQDMASEEVSATLAESFQLASALGIHGTPGYVIDDHVVQGAIGAAGLKREIDSERARPAH